MLVFYPPKGQIGSLMQVIHECRILLDTLESPEIWQKFSEDPQAMTGLMQAPPHNAIMVNIYYTDDGRLCIEAFETAESIAGE